MTARRLTLVVLTATFAFAGQAVVPFAGASAHAAVGARVVRGGTGSASEWLQQAELAGSDRGIDDGFGYSMASSGSTLVVGALYHGSVGGSTGPGAAYVFKKTGSGWVQTAELTASDGVLQDAFGRSVAISGSTIVVGADGQSFGMGAVYVFTDTASGWVQTAEIKDPLVHSFNSDEFGHSVAVSGNTLIATAPKANDTADMGAAFIYGRTKTGWVLRQTFLPTTNDFFGSSVAISGSVALIGATREQVGPFFGAGAVYVVADTGSGWVQQAKLNASDAGILQSFGASVAISGSTAVVGAQYGGVGQVGSAYVFINSGTGWTQQAEFSDRFGDQYEDFSASVAINNRTIVVGVPYRRRAHGAAYVYEENGGVWTRRAKLFPTDARPHEAFGQAVSIADASILVGAPQHKTNHILGVAYAFSRQKADTSARRKWGAS